MDGNEGFRQRVLRVISNPLFIGSIFSIYAIFIRFYIFPKVSAFITADFELIENFIEWFGVAYGLFITLVLVNVWAQYDGTEREFDREADAIFKLYESAKQIKEARSIKPLKDRIIAGIKAYVSHVVENYREEHDRLFLRSRGDKILDDIRVTIAQLIHTTERESLVSELIKEFSETIDVRGDRISNSKQRIPDPVWTISLVSSIFWLIPFYGLNFKSDWLAVILVGGVTAIVVAILLIIKDLDDPFIGTWKIDLEEWDILGEHIELKPTLFFIFNLDSSPLSVFRAFLGMFSLKPLCRLYSYLSTARKQELLTTDLDDSAYIKIYYHDQFEYTYGMSVSTLPVVLFKLGDTMETLLDTTQVNMTTSTDGLKRLVKQELRKRGW
jgi:hypothetical protein